MRYIEPHGHMVSRVTDDYVDMAAAGCACVCEPAFWAGYDRSSVDGFFDYFCQLTDYEPKRAAKFGLAHFCWLCINPKESKMSHWHVTSLASSPNSSIARTCSASAKSG
jgi:predicted metal-dependent TIM-barrel fold hydrolase